MSVKSTFENHPVVWGLGLLFAGFIAGFGARAYLLPVPAKEFSCTVEGMPALEDAHAKDLAVLNAKLVELEAKASDDSLIPSYQDRYKESADRIRNDIERSHRTYLSALESLSKKCK